MTNIGKLVCFLLRTWFLSLFYGIQIANPDTSSMLSCALQQRKVSAFLLLVQVQTNCRRAFQTPGYSSVRFIVC